MYYTYMYLQKLPLSSSISVPNRVWWPNEWFPCLVPGRGMGGTSLSLAAAFARQLMKIMQVMHRYNEGVVAMTTAGACARIVGV